MFPLLHPQTQLIGEEVRKEGHGKQAARKVLDRPRQRKKGIDKCVGQSGSARWSWTYHRIPFLHVLGFRFRSGSKLPIVVSIGSEYSSLDLGSNSFGTQPFDLKQEKVQLFPTSQKLANGEPLKLLPNETFLDEIKVNEQWGKRGAGWNGIENYCKGTSLVGGGPSRSVTAYFISCLIAREERRM